MVDTGGRPGDAQHRRHLIADQDRGTDAGVFRLDFPPVGRDPRDRHLGGFALNQLAPIATGTQLGYARVSMGHQSLDQQVDALTEAGVDPKRVYSDKLSGTPTREQRSGLAALLDYARSWRCNRGGWR